MADERFRIVDETESNYFQIDENFNVSTTGDLAVGDDATVSGNLSVTGSFAAGGVTTYTASGAIALTDSLALLDATSGALAMTLADGTAGQQIVIKCIDATNNAVTTPANLFDGSTLTADAANEVAHLIFDGTNWNIIANTTTLA